MRRSTLAQPSFGRAIGGAAAGRFTARLAYVSRLASALAIACTAAAVLLMAVSPWAALLPLAFWSGWVRLSDP